MVKKAKKVTGVSRVTSGKWRMPSAFAIVFAIACLMAALTWVIPSGKYELNADDAPIAGTYQQVEKVTTDADGVTTDTRQGVYEALSSPVKGTVQAIDVVLFVLVIGGFLGMTMKSGALNALLGNVVKKLKGREQWIIPVLMTLFAVGGTTYGMQEETVAFYALVVPLMLAAGFNGMTAAMTIILGAGVGVLGSTINPFSTGIASGFADISIGDGQVERLAILVLTLIAAIWTTMRYAAKVKAGQHKEDSVGDAKISFSSKGLVPAFTLKRKAIATVFALTFVVMILSVIPWETKFGITFFADANKWLHDLPVIGLAFGQLLPLGDWWFNELSVLFFVATLIIGAIHYSGKGKRDADDTFFATFIAGARDLLAVALIVGFSRGISVVMNDGQIMDTIIHTGEVLLTNVASWALPGLSFLVYLPLSFLIPSTSGLATASMPIMAPLADFSGVDRHFMVTAFATAEGVVNMIAPTVASVMGGLALAKVSYGLWVRRTWRFMIVVSLISILVMTISVLLQG